MKNPDLRWEKTAQYNIGLDFAILKNNLSFTFDYYVKNTSDLLFKKSVPSSTGFTNYYANIGGMRINGLEFSVNSKNITRKNFTWQTDFNISTDRGIVTNLGGLPPFIINGDWNVAGGTQTTDVVAKIEEGARLNNLYGYVVDGVLPLGFQDQYQYRSSTLATKEAGDLNFKDINGDGRLNQDDIAVIGNANPDFFFGFNNTFTYKNWRLNVFLQGSVGNQKMYMLYKSLYLNSMTNSFTTLFDERWTEQNPNNVSPAVGYDNRTSSFMLKDASYLRIQNISLSYNVPVKKFAGLSSLRVFANAVNLFTITNYPGYNPADSQQDNLIKGFDSGGYPLQKTISMGLSMTF
jgi:hypothetical protein